MSIQPGGSGHPVHPNPPAARADARVVAEKGKCDHCFIIIVWAKTEPKYDAKKMPVDAAPAEDGNVLLYADDKWGLVASVVGARGRRRALADAGWKLYKHHRLSCPFASRWASKPGGGTTPTRTYKRRSRA